MLYGYGLSIIMVETNISSLSLHFNGHFPGGPGLAGTRMSPFWILLELRMTEVLVTTGATRCAKLQSNRHHQQTNNQFFLQARCPSCRPTKQLLLLLLLLLHLFKGQFPWQPAQVSSRLWNHSGCCWSREWWRWQWWKLYL